jgi:hemerythrin
MYVSLAQPGRHVMMIWTSDYETGNAAMDGEHALLMALVNELAIEIDADEGGQRVVAAADTLVASVRSHFSHEEGLLEALAFPCFREHKAQHHEMLQELEELHAMLTAQSDRRAAITLRDLMHSWLRGHILYDDKAYAVATVTG